FALALLEKYLQQTPDLEHVGSCRSPVRAVEMLQNESVELLFLDIQMPLLNGLQLLRHVSNRPVTILTTAYPQYAQEAYELDVVDYLLKPFSFERFERAVEKARQAMQFRSATAEGPAGMLTVKTDRKWVKIAYADILYIEGWKEYVKIFTATEKVITLERLSQLEQTLPAGHFLRVHKSYIVAKQAVRGLEGAELVVGGARIPVARARRRAVTEALFPG
ncbi:MAG: response regulator transcription factor, partial [Saprospiraceae bacterium]|nr:response regulator transcription factor [Saprospiraceae bacterium]